MGDMREKIIGIYDVINAPNEIGETLISEEMRDKLLAGVEAAETLLTENSDLKLTIEMLRSMDGRGQIERLTAEGALKDAVIRAVIAFRDEPESSDRFEILHNELDESLAAVSGRQQCEYCASGDMAAPICGDEAHSEDNVWACTRPPRHEGDHVACGAHHNIARWHQSAADLQQHKESK